jgi:AcrR family transcriptional regulator
MQAVALPTREHLVATARSLLDTEGLEPLTLREIARRGGLSHGAPLRHFPSLVSLMAAVAAAGFRELVASVDSAVAKAGPHATALERLAAAGRGYVRFATGSPGVFALMFHPDRVDRADPGYQQAGTAAFGQLVGLVEAAQRDGFRPDVPATRLASAVWAAIHGLSQLALQGALSGASGEELEPTLDLMNDLLLGVRAGAPSVSPRRRPR